MRNVSDRRCRENQKVFYVIFLENLALYEIIWKNILQPGMPQMTIWLMYIACWITKDKSPHSEYVLRIVSPLQQLLNKRISILHFTYTVFLLLSEARFSVF